MTDHVTVPQHLPTTLGALRASGWVSTAVKDEMRRNAIAKIRAGEPLFDGVMGYEHTVMPQLENALLAGHDIVFLGERGQAKTRMIRSLTGLLDEWMPIVAGSARRQTSPHASLSIRISFPMRVRLEASCAVTSTILRTAA